ncbi:hypothetical protein FXF08_03115 [Vibrio cholerae]|uniref:hypothetical protein n=1 Tax=Vibrio TaxID=662 RepID=UPI000DE3B1A2|nr:MULTISPECIES: hypothetical protein [Vibrio]NAR39717.1 hypothetical protein [Vibrio cholerae]RBM64402.1 hypothetical protein DLR71_05410 [Vibrio paracholerae]TXX94657.1 hypothetical protein FXF08_03115 [Vibrio cholerae]GIC26402.1 Hypothetical protein VCSRO146_2939 [Vibrio cholerae]
MACSINVEFSSESKRALDEIAEMKDMANALSAFIGVSAMMDIFAGNGVIGSSYKIATTDFELLAKSMHSSNPILIRQVENIAARMYMKSSISQDEKVFWRCLYNEL